MDETDNAIEERYKKPDSAENGRDQTYKQHEDEGGDEG